jgi:putative nucleotidyltransferase with HDIG domain
MQQDIALEFVQLMMRCYQGLRLYPAQHPNIRRQLQEWLQTVHALFRDEPRILLGVHQETLFCNNELFSEPVPAAEALMKILQDCHLQTLAIRQGVSERELLDFLVITANGSRSAAELRKALNEASIRNIELLKFTDDEDQEENPARQIYQQALQVTETIFRDVRMGQIPSSSEASKVVKGLVEATLADPHALLALSLIKDYDDYTFTHSVNVSVIALAVGRARGLGKEDLRVLGMGGLLHDLGKLKIDIGIINKPGRLTSNEFDAIKEHPQLGAQILREMQQIPPAVIEMTLCHHLRYDGSGYPESETRKTLLPMTHMVTIADAYDAMTTLRPYQRPLTPRRALQHLQEQVGVLYHPQIVKSFVDDLGPYPVGSLIRLQDNRIALVFKVGLHGSEVMQLKVLFDEEGRQLSAPDPLDLPTSELWRIVAEVDPLSKGIQVTDFLN